MSNGIIKCQACGEALNLSDQFCPKCGYELHIYPNPVPKEVEEYENARLENWKNQMSKIIAQNNNDSLVESLKEENKKLEAFSDEQSKQIETLKSEQKQIQNLLDREKVAHQKTKDQLYNNNNSSDIVGVVSIKNRTSGVIQYLLINNGVNTYGTDNCMSKSHHEIKIKTRGNIINNVHFSIEKNSNGQMVIKPLNGTLMCDGLYIPPSGKSVQSQHVVLIDNVIEIHVSKI